MVNYAKYLPTTGGTVTGAVTISAGGLNVTGDEVQNGHLQFAGNQPSVAAGANAGGTPPAPVVGTGANDNGGSFTFGTGTLPAAGAQAVVTFHTAFTNLTANPHVVLTAGNAATQALGLYVSARSPSAFTVSCVNAPAASQANTVYAVNYVVVG